MFLPEIYGLDFSVPLSSIVRLEATRTLLRRVLKVVFVEGGPPPVELQLRDEASFIRQLGEHVPVVGSRTPLPVAKSRKSYRLITFRIFMAIWGAGALFAAYSGLPDDYRYRRDGITVTGKFESHSGENGQRNDMGILSYSVGGQSYHLTSLRGPGVYRIGDVEQLFYLPGRPDRAREADYLLFDLMWLGLGLAALMLSLFSGRIVRWMT
jgi:hypothetical protein